MDQTTEHRVIGSAYDLTKKVAHEVEISFRFMGMPGTRMPGTELINSWEIATICLNALGLPTVTCKDE